MHKNNINITDFLNNLEINNSSYIIVGVSAGPDSMALLHILQTSLDCKIVCAHVNHNVRKESKIEELYLKSYCLNNHIIFEKALITEYHENNFENEARKKRYKFYEEVIKKYHAKYLFLGHHGDDLIETVLMKIIRGSNIEGYLGINEIIKKNNYYLVRPLLKYQKEDLINYNKLHNIRYFLDKSNYDNTYTRNYIRNNILPILYQLDRNINQKFYKYSSILKEYDTYIKYEIKNIKPHVYQNNKINIKVLNEYHPFIKKNIIYEILKDIYHNQENIIKEKNLEDILRLINSNKPNQNINLPKNYIAQKKYQQLEIKKNIPTSPKKYKFPYHDNIEINGFIFKTVKSAKNNSNQYCRLNTEKINMPLYLRNRKNGDYLETLGLNGRQKIKDIFIDKKIPLEERDAYPLLVDKNDNIIWIPYLKKSKYIVKNNEFCDIILTSQKKGEDNNEKEK